MSSIAHTAWAAAIATILTVFMFSCTQVRLASDNAESDLKKTCIDKGGSLVIGYGAYNCIAVGQTKSLSPN